MHPFLIDTLVNGHVFRLPSYGVLLAIAFSTAYFLGLRRAVQVGVDPRHIENMFLLIVASSIVGARLFHVLFEDFSYYWDHPGKIIAVWEGGYTFYGALLSCLLSLFLYTKIKKVSFLQLVDIAAPPTALGLFIGRLGCFFAGCCWGRPTEMPWGVIFPNPEAFAVHRNTPLHPTQIYEAIGGLLIFIYLQYRFKHRQYIGQVFLHGVSIYAVVRFGIEFFRGDDYRGYLFGGIISYSQFVSLMILPFAFTAMFLYSKPEEKSR